MARRGKIQLLASAALAIEYEAVCRREEHWRAAGLSKAEVGSFLDAVIELIEPVEIWFPGARNYEIPATKWCLRRRLNGRADVIATFNLRDFRARSTALRDTGSDAQDTLMRRTP